MLPFRSLGTVEEHENRENDAFKDTTCLIWAVLALTRLHEKVLPFDEALEIYQNRGGAWAFRLRNALDDAIQSFCDVHMKNICSTLYTDRVVQIVNNLEQTVTDYLHHTEERNGKDDEIAHLYQVFHDFYRRITLGHPNHQGPFGSVGMLAAVSVRMKTIAANEVSETLTMFMTLAAFESPSAHVENYLEERLSVICTAIERFIRERKDLNALSIYDPEGIVGDDFVPMIRART